jgi:hypothetical protein
MVFRLILMSDLFCGAVYAQGVHAGGTSLHLQLRVVDAWLVVEKTARENGRQRPPVEPQIVAGEGDEHGAHTEVEPA